MLITTRYIIQEFVDGGELYSTLLDLGSFDEETAVRLFRQLISGLAYCHQFQICHRDVKPENLLLDSLGNLKLCDFGMACLHYTDKLNTSCGSPHYVAPEVAKGHAYRGEPADVWSAGVVLFVMLTSRLPFGHDCRPDEVGKVIQLIIRGVVDYRGDLSLPAMALFQRIFNTKPERRMTIDDIWKHPFIRQYDHMVTHPDPEISERWQGGPPPQLTENDCGDVLRPDQIDKDVLRSLCLLWHSGDPVDMMNHLTSPMCA